MDISKPFLVAIDPDDCFGNEWDPRDKVCAICAEIDVCGIMTARVKNPVRAVTTQAIIPLDMADFEGVPWDKLLKYIKSVEDTEPVTKDELLQAVKESANISDDITVELYLERVMPLKRLALDREGRVKFIG